MNIKRIVLIASAVLIGLVIVLFVVAVVLAQLFGGSINNAVEVIRDLVIIFLALEGIMIVLALSILILQVARLINLVQNEVKPIVTDTRDTVRNAKGTVDFVGTTVSAPLIKASAFFAGVGALVSDVGGIRRALKKTAEEAKEAVDA